MSKFQRNYWQSPFPRANWEGEYASQDPNNDSSQSQAQSPSPVSSTPLTSVTSLSRSQSITRIAPPRVTEADLQSSSRESSPPTPLPSVSTQVPVTPSTPTQLASIPEDPEAIPIPQPLPPAYFQSASPPIQHHIQLHVGAVFHPGGALVSLKTQVKWSYHPCITGLEGTKKDQLKKPKGLFKFVIFPILNRPFILYRSILPCYSPPESLSLSPLFPDVAQPPTLISATHHHLSELNSLIPSHLIKTRLILALVEIFNYILLILLIIGFAVTKSKQKGLLEVAEVGIVIGIIVNAAGVNWVRIIRWKLRRELRDRSRNWSPSPVARRRRRDENNNRQFRDVLNQTELGESPNQEVEVGLEEEETKLRWNMVSTEGGYWTSYRPVVRIELMFPPNKSMLIAPAESILRRSEDDSHGSHPVEGHEEPPSYFNRVTE